MGAFIHPSDLAPFADIDAVKAAAMIEDAEAMAVLTAPCLPGLLTAPDGETDEARTVREAKIAALRAILRGALLRWNEAGTGALSSRQETAGPFGQTVSMDTRQTRKAMFWPSEIEQLQGLCASGEKGTAFSIDTVPSAPAHHLPWCSLTFGATYCSCGTDIAGRPIHEGA